MRTSSLRSRVLLTVVVVALAACDGEVDAPDAATDAGGEVDAGASDAGGDAGRSDAGSDAGRSDAGSDAGPSDAGPTDAGSTDAGGADAGPGDGGDGDGGPAPDGGVDGGVDPEDPDGDGVVTALEAACGTDPNDGGDFPEATALRGAGSDADPYRLCFAEHLALFAALPGVATAHARLGDDLDFAGVTPPDPIGSTGAPYDATFDGDGHTISNLTVGAAGDARVGLFDVVGAAGEIRDLLVVGAVSFRGSPLVAINRGAVRRVTVDAVASGGDHVGLLVNHNAATGVVEDCSSTGSLTAINSHVGGLVGENLGTVLRCESAADVSAQNRTGGLVGSGNGRIEQSSASGTVTGAGRFIGGLLGTAFDLTVVVDCYATGAVSAGMSAGGGVVGSAEGSASISRVYAQNVVTTATPQGVLGQNVGGTAVLSDCYFDSGLTAADASCTALTGAQMMSEASFVGFDFTTPVWRIALAVRSSPILDWQ